MAAADRLGVHRDRQQATRLALPGVAQLARPDLLDLRRGAHRADPGATRLEVGPVVEGPADRDLDQRSGHPQVRAGPGVVDLAAADPVEPDVVAHQAGVVAEAELRGEVQGLVGEGPVGRPEAARGRARDPGHGLDAAGHDVALGGRVELGEVLVGPAVTADLVTGRDDRGDAIGEGGDRVTGHEPGARDPLALEEGQDPRSADPRPELAPRAEDRPVAPVDLGRDRVVVEGQGDGQPRLGHGRWAPIADRAAAARPLTAVSLPSEPDRSFA